MKPKKIFAIISAIIVLFCFSGFSSFASYTQTKIYSEKEIITTAENIVKWKKQSINSDDKALLFNSDFLEAAGTTQGDWYAIAFGRLGIADDYDGYLAVLKDYVENKYKQDGKLSRVKSTEWHRISLAVLSMGGDPTSFGTDEKGKPINLIADGTYNRGNTVSLGRQGLNGWIWGLITLDSGNYKIPSGSFYSRNDIIKEIIKRQKSDGGFSLSADSLSDADITAMAVQALSPYYNKKSEVKKSIDSALNYLSEAQLNSGDFKSSSTENSESTAQVIIALCCLNINPQTDSRFIKNKNTLLNGLMNYKTADGGFIHSYSYDESNTSASPKASNSMAGEQALCALAAVYRQMNNMNTLYDFSDEKINNSIYQFTSADKKDVDSLPENPSTKNYVDIIKLLSKINQSPNFAGKAQYKSRLLSAKNQIANIQKEINSINEEIKEKLYPFNNISVKDKKTVDGIVTRYNKLSDYDKTKIDSYNDVIKAKTKIDNKLRAIIIFVILAAIVVALLTVIIKRLKAKANKKQIEMDELAAQYGNDE